MIERSGLGLWLLHITRGIISFVLARSSHSGMFWGVRKFKYLIVKSENQTQLSNFLAAHCFQNKGQPEVVPSQHVTAHVGKFNLNVISEPGSKSSWVSEIIIHPDWKPQDEKFDADLAVVVLGEEIQFTEFIQSVSLPQQSEDDVNGSGTIVGWGQSSNAPESYESFEETPMELEMPVLRASHCYPRFPDLARIASARMFCAGYDTETKGACLGDSGGGFYALHSTQSSRFLVKGIVSSSLLDNYRNCDVNKFSLYTNVARFVNWIGRKMKETKEISWTEVKLDCEIPR